MEGSEDHVVVLLVVLLKFFRGVFGKSEANSKVLLVEHSVVVLEEVQAKNPNVEHRRRHHADDADVLVEVGLLDHILLLGDVVVHPRDREIEVRE